jgi:hypothetical protein
MVASTLSRASSTSTSTLTSSTRLVHHALVGPSSCGVGVRRAVGGGLNDNAAICWYIAVWLAANWLMAAVSSGDTVDLLLVANVLQSCFRPLPLRVLGG